MYRDIVEKYHPLIASVFGKRPQYREEVGLACYVDEQRLITAHSVIEQATLGRRILAVSRWDGVYAATLVWADEDVGVAILRITDKLEDSPKPSPTPTWWPPTVAAKQIKFGLGLGYNTILLQTNIHGVRSSIMGFYAASVSFHYKDGEWPTAWCLDSGNLDSRFCGGPVFMSDGSLVSILLGQAQFDDTVDAMPFQIVTFPVIASTDSIAAQINAAIADDKRP